MSDTTETTILDDSAVNEIEARANAATKGPWEPRDVSPFGDGILIDTVHDGLRGAIASVVNPARFMSFVRQQEEKDSQTRANALFIQHAREDIPALCATVKHLQAELSTTKGQWAEMFEKLASALLKRDDLQSQLEQLRADLREQRDTIKFWQRHIQRMGQLLHCVAMDIDVEQAAKDLLSRLAQVEQERNDLRQEVEGLRYQRMFTDSHIGDD